MSARSRKKKTKSKSAKVEAIESTRTHARPTNACSRRSYSRVLLVFLLLVAMIASVRFNVQSLLLVTSLSQKAAAEQNDISVSKGEKSKTTLTGTKESPNTLASATLSPLEAPIESPWLLDPSPVLLLNQPIGSVQRTCHDHRNHTHGCLVNTGNSCDVMRPMVIRPRPWMSPLLLDQDMILYHSSHTSHREGHDVNINGIRQGKGVDLPGVDLAFPDASSICRTVHSPSIFVSDEEQMLYMFVNGNTCKTFEKIYRGPMKFRQPIVLFVSRDGIKWRLRRPDKPLEGHAINGSSPFQIHNHFYLSLPVKHSDGYYYALAKTQTSGMGSARLFRAFSLSGPFEEGPIVANAVRHADTLIRGSHLYVFYTLILDTPERLLMGTIHLDDSVDWKHWALLPGPTLLTPVYPYEHGNAELRPSKQGPARCKPAHQLRDPRFLPDVGTETDSRKLTGLLFYAVQGEGGIASARLSMDLDKYHSVVANRIRSNIHKKILDASSLEKMSDPPSGKVLVTGTGRSGTTFLCSAFNAIGIHLSHDNNEDCGPYPGPDGAVSWYDVFRTQNDKYRYTHALLVVRNPLDTIESRKSAATSRYPNFNFYFKRIGKYAELSDLEIENDKNITWEEIDRRTYSFSLKFYIRWNSFAERHASWTERTEDIQMGNPLALWRLCMAGHFGVRCPDLETIQQRIKKLPSLLNSFFSDATLSKAQKNRGKGRPSMPLLNRTKLSWEKLEKQVGPENHKYVLIAKQMAVDYGYERQEVIGYQRTSFYCDFSEGTTHWDCFLKQNISQPDVPTTF